MNDIEVSVKNAVTELLEVSDLKENQILVLGMSTSEVQGRHIGKHSNQEVGEVVVKALLDILKPKGIHLAVQGCEHINRALVVEREVAEKFNFEQVDVVPALHAGGAGSVAAFKYFEDPVEVETIQADAGLDIGDTFIGMHIKRVLVPVRLQVKKIGEAHLTAARRRLKKIGGERAQYLKVDKREK